MRRGSTMQSVTATLGRMLLVWALVCPSYLAAQDMPVPIRLHVPILLKTLTFDRNLKSRCGDAVIVGVLFQSDFRQSFTTKEELMNDAGAVPVQTVDGLPVRFVAIDLSSDDDPEIAMTRARVNTLYIAPLRTIDIKSISTLARSHRCLTLTGVPEYVGNGLSIGVWNRGNRPALVIDVRSAKEEGADLDSQLLNLARIVK